MAWERRFQRSTEKKDEVKKDFIIYSAGVGDASKLHFCECFSKESMKLVCGPMLICDANRLHSFDQNERDRGGKQRIWCHHFIDDLFRLKDIDSSTSGYHLCLNCNFT